MLDFIEPKKRKILLQYGFIKDLDEGKKIPKEIFDQDLERFREEILKQGVHSYELETIKRYAGGCAVYLQKEKIAVNYDKYCFPGNITCSINPVQPTFSSNVRFNPESLYRLNKILNLKEAPLNRLIETVGRIVNDSMEYDFERAAEKDKKFDWSATRNAYKPTGKETMKGVCSDAGLLIRCILKSLRFEKHIMFYKIATIGTVAHDLTLVYDSNTERWVLISSKRGVEESILVPKQELARFGALWPSPDEDNTSAYFVKK
jgi:hypothetical protein